jgi:hypothetical protein
MKIGQSVVLYCLEREGLVERAAIITELDEKPEMVHLTVYNRPISDCVMNGASVLTTARSIRFVESGPPDAGVSAWCNPVNPGPTLRAKIIKTPR